MNAASRYHEIVKSLNGGQSAAFLACRLLCMGCLPIEVPLLGRDAA
jgi:hypothetical protein